MFPGPYVDQVEHAAIMSMPLPTDDNLLAPLHLPSDFSKAADDVWTGWTYGADSEYYIWYRFEQYLTPISYLPSDKYSTMGNAGNLDYTLFGAEREQWFAESISVEFVWKTAGAALNSWATEGEVVTLADVQRIHEEMPAVQVYTLSSAPSVSFNQLTAWELIATQSRMDEIVLLYNTLQSATFPNLPSLTSPDILDASQVEDFMSKTVVAFLGLHRKSATPPTSVSEYADSVPWLKNSWFEEQVSVGGGGGGPSPPPLPIQRLSDVATTAFPGVDPDKLLFMLWRTAWDKPENTGCALSVFNIPDNLETLDASNFLWQHGFNPRTGESSSSFRGGGEGSYYKDITFITKPEDVALPVRTAMMAYGYSSGWTSSSIDLLLSTGKAFMYQSFAAEPPRVYNVFVDLQERRGFNVIVGLQMLKPSEKQPLEDGIALKDEDFLDDVLQMNQQYAAAYEEAVNNGLKPEFPTHLMVAEALANGRVGIHEWFTLSNPNNVDGLLESWNDYLSIYGRNTTHPITGETILTQSEPWNTLFTGLGEMREAFLSVPVPEDIFDITTSPVAKYDDSTWKLSPAVQVAFASPGMDLSSTFTMDQLSALPVGYDWTYLAPIGLMQNLSPSQLPVAYPASYSTIDAAVADVQTVAFTLATSRAAAHPKSSPPFALSSNATSLTFADFTVCSLHYGFDANVGRQLRPLPGGFKVRYDEPIPAWSFAISKESYANYELSFTLTFTGRLAQSHNWVTAIAPGVAGGIKLGLQSQSQEPVSSHIQLSPYALGTFMLANPATFQVSQIPFPDVGTHTLLSSNPTLPLHFVIRMRDGTVQYSINGKQSAEITIPGPTDGHIGFELEFSDFDVTDLSILSLVTEDVQTEWDDPLPLSKVVLETEPPKEAYLYAQNVGSEPMTLAEMHALRTLDQATLQYMKSTFPPDEFVGTADTWEQMYFIEDGNASYHRAIGGTYEQLIRYVTDVGDILLAASNLHGGDIRSSLPAITLRQADVYKMYSRNLDSLQSKFRAPDAFPTFLELTNATKELYINDMIASNEGVFATITTAEAAENAIMAVWPSTFEAYIASPLFGSNVQGIEYVHVPVLAE